MMLKNQTPNEKLRWRWIENDIQPHYGTHGMLLEATKILPEGETDFADRPRRQTRQTNNDRWKWRSQAETNGLRQTISKQKRQQ